MKTKRTVKTEKAIPKVAADVSERDLVARKGVLVGVVKMLPAKNTKASKTLVKKCKHRPRVATPRPQITCMECRPSWAKEMEKPQREALAKKAADFQRRYNA